MGKKVAPGEAFELACITPSCWGDRLVWSNAPRFGLTPAFCGERGVHLPQLDAEGFHVRFDFGPHLGEFPFALGGEKVSYRSGVGHDGILDEPVGWYACRHEPDRRNRGPQMVAVEGSRL